MDNTYKKVKLGNVVTIRRGASPRPIQDYISRKLGIPWIKIADATAAEGKYIKRTKEFIKEEGVKHSVKVHQGDLILSNSATPGLPKFVNMEACIHDGWLLLTNFKDIDKEYLYYLLISKQKELIHSARGTVFKNLQTDIVRDVEISLPPLPEQHRIANILSSFDNKIELLRKENNTLEDIAQSIFKEWFVKYNFPNKDGKPYRDNNEKMIDSELGLIPQGWRVGKLGEIINCFDSKRIPLAKEIREQRKGIYPYYGATEIMGYVDSFLFDGEYLLLAEDGSVQTEKGYPILQLIDEKFWVNNHTHVLQGKDPFTTEYLYLLMKDFNITNIITGAVQPKINQNNLLGQKIIIPDIEVLKKFRLVQHTFGKVLKNRIKVQNLTKIKDKLLKKLII